VKILPKPMFHYTIIGFWLSTGIGDIFYFQSREIKNQAYAWLQHGGTGQS
jgi:hypothetical protein